MKHCPKCSRYYADETLQYCLEDGTPLNLQSYETNDLSGEQETIVLSKTPDKINFDLNRSEHIGQDQMPPVTNTKIQTAPVKSNTPLIIALTAMIMLLLFGVIGIGAYFYMNGKDSKVAQNTEFTANKNNTSINSKNTNKTIESNITSKTPQKVEKSPTPKPTETAEKTPVSEVETEEIKKGIAQRLSSWKSQAEAINLENYMNSYADEIDYYNNNGASKKFVRNDKQRAFRRYDLMKVNLSNISIIASKDGQTANVLFDKAWSFSGADNSSSGKVRQQLKLKKEGENWLITSEKDLKIYYINK